MNPIVERLAYRALPVAMILGVLALLRVTGAGVAGAGAQSTTIAVGFLLIGSFLGGKLAVRARLPRITGYLLVGIVAGPHASGLLTQDMLFAAKTVEGIAVALIALTAGGEIRLDWVRRQAKKLVLITTFQLLFAAIGVLAVVLVARSLLSFLAQDDFVTMLMIALVFVAIAISNSPMVTIAVIAENEADGPVARTVLGVVILMDLVIIILFAIVLAVARDVLGAAGGTPLGVTLTRELLGSAVVGVAFGIGIASFLKRVARDTPVFMLAACFAMFKVAEAFQLETLLIALTAGFWVENFSRARGDALIKGVEQLSLPVYALFFAAAGAKVDIDTFVRLWPLALLIGGVRALSVWSGTRLGARLSGAEPEVARYAWLGLISQAGVTLALSSIVARTFPGWGREMQALIIALIAMHELIGPIAFQAALRRAGEVGRARRKETEPASGTALAA
jgi:Kef-type K+ transport system membrane component KefB